MDKLHEFVYNHEIIPDNVHFKYPMDKGPKGNARVNGISKSHAQKLVNLIIALPDEVNNDPMHAYNSGIFTEMIRYMFYDELPFHPVVDGRLQESKLISGQPNAIYRNFLVSTLLSVDEFNKKQLGYLQQLFISLDENAITGFMYLPAQGGLYKQIKAIYDSLSVKIFYKKFTDPFFLGSTKVQNGIILNNTELFRIVTAKLNK